MAQAGAPQRGNPNPPPQTQGTGQVQVEYWKAQCGENRMLRLDGGKGRKVLPIRTRQILAYARKRRNYWAKWTRKQEVSI